MSADTPSYPADAGSKTFLLTVRGKTNATTIGANRELHDTTAGEPRSVAGARALGDLSHHVYAPLGGEEDELLFLDYWNSVSGVGQFFSNPQVQAAAAQLFAERDGVVWAPASGFGSWSLPVPFSRASSGIGLLRAPVTTIEAAASGFSTYSSATITTARSRGLVSHSTWLRVPMPGEGAVAEVIGVDVWSDAEQMNDYYALGIGFEHLGPPLRRTAHLVDLARRAWALGRVVRTLPGRLARRRARPHPHGTGGSATWSPGSVTCSSPKAG